jgi:hypothetical protein
MFGILGILLGGDGAYTPRYQGSPLEYKSGVTTNYAGQAFRTQTQAGNKVAKSRGGLQRGVAGWNTEAARGLGVGSKSRRIDPHTTGTWSPQNDIESLTNTIKAGYGGEGVERYTRQTYPLGYMSKEFYDKYMRWAGTGVVNEQGWRSTLSQSPGSRSTSKPSQMFKSEVFQTLEVRRASPLTPYTQLVKHANTSRLNPNLAFLYKDKKEVGAVRRTVKRV